MRKGNVQPHRTRRLQALYGLFASFLFAGSVFAGFTETVGWKTETTSLSNAVVYQVGVDKTVTSTSAGASPITLGAGVTSVVYIARGVTLTLTGAAGSSQTAGGPAICLADPSAVLVVAGHGTLVATGGNGGNGSTGSAGGDGSKDGTYLKCGAGGAGGAGGGAAAVAIGAKGGRGGDARGGPTTSYSPTSNTQKSFETQANVGNKAGYEGNAGAKGGDNGRVYILGDVTVVAAHGTGGTKGGVSSTVTGGAHTGSSYDYFVGGGAGGGGGGGGPEPTIAIGGGTGGGGSGGSGATGTAVASDNANKSKWYPGLSGDDWEDAWMLGGYGGKGGRSESDARQGDTGKNGGNTDDAVRDYWGCDTITRNGDDFDGGTRSPYAGGAGGLKGENGDDGKIYYMQTATVSAEMPQSVTTVLSESQLKESNYSQVPAGVVYTIYFYQTSGSWTSTKIILGGQYPLIELPEREHYRFKGYYTEPNGCGTKYYDANGKIVLDDDENYYEIFDDLILYAAWELEGESSEAIEVKGGETLVLDEMGGTNEYFQASDQTLFTVRAGGRLELKNLTFWGNEDAFAGLIRNEGTLVVSNCAFHSCSGRKSRGGVYRDFPGAEARFIRCTFDSCAAVEGGVIAASGSRVQVWGSTFICNQALNTAVDQPGGGAFFAQDGAELSVAGCTFYLNRAHASDNAGAVFAFYSDTDGAAQASILYNCLFQLYSNCTNVFNGTHWEQFSAAANYLSKDSAGGTTALATLKTDGYLQQAKDRTVAKVAHSTYKAYGSFRTDGVAERLFETADWPYVHYEPGTDDPPAALGEPFYDQLMAYPTAGYGGARTGNQLQHIIDVTPAGGTTNVPAANYEGVVIRKPITLIGVSSGLSVIDGEGLEPCVIYEEGGADAVWVNFTFSDGANGEGSGGGWKVVPETGYYGTASNCVFKGCTASSGGAAVRAKEFIDVIFVGNTASQNGGATYGCQLVSQCLYQNNLSYARGGGSYKDELVRGTLFYGNTAQYGGGGSDGTYKLCTFARNAATAGEAFGGAYDATLVGCIFYGSPVPSGDLSQAQFSKQLTGGQFVDSANADFHLALRDSSGNKLTHDDVAVTNTTIVKEVYDEKWLDYEGTPFVSAHPVSGDLYLYAGCYAFAPFKTSGMRVTGTDEWYLDTNTKTSLREAVEMAAEFAPTATGELTVTFDDGLFKYGDTVVFGFGEAQIDLKAFTNATLVVQGPSNRVVVIDGNRSYRAFRVFSNNCVRLENLYFRNCFGSPYGTSPQPGNNGGALLNYGNMFVSNCVFAANRAGNAYVTLPNDAAPVGYGGALATGLGGTSTVYAATFAGNRAAKGGAIWTADGGASRVYYSTFAGNVADGTSVTDPAGGACAMERKSYSSKGGDLWLVNCLLAGNRVTKVAETGGAVSGAKTGLVLLNSVVVGNYAANATNDIAMPAGGTAHFYYTAYGTRTASPQTGYSAQKITYIDLCATGGVAYADAIGLTNDTPVSTIAMPQTVLPLAHSFAVNGTNVWTTADLSTLGYGGTTKSSVQVLAGGSRYQLLKSGTMRTVNQLGVSQLTNGVVVLGPTTVKGVSVRGDDGDEEESGSKPAYDDEDQVAATNGVCYLVKIDGATNYYPTVSTALKHWQPGDFATVKSQDDEALNEQFFDAFDVQLREYAESHPWYDYEYVGDDILKLSLTLNEEAKPTIEGDFTVSSSKDTVSVKIGNVKPGLWYALGHSDAPDGEYVCEKWVQADDSGNLKDFLTAGKEGDSGFYRVIVAPYVR